MSLHRFEWISRGELAAMARPDGEAEDWEELKRRGIGAVVNLTTRGFAGDGPAEHGLRYLHLPVPDFTPPEPEQVDRFVEFVDEQLDDGRAVAVHCMAGRGRTGTMLACYMVHDGTDAEQAIGFIRSIVHGAIETRGQENAVREYARRLGR
jgi:atypical dual specificity phosphatase